MYVCIYIYIPICIVRFKQHLGNYVEVFLFPIVHAHILMRQIYEKDFSLIILLEHCYETRRPYKSRGMYQVYQLIQIRYSINNITYI